MYAENILEFEIAQAGSVDTVLCCVLVVKLFACLACEGTASQTREAVSVGTDSGSYERTGNSDSRRS